MWWSPPITVSALTLILHNILPAAIPQIFKEIFLFFVICPEKLNALGEKFFLAM
jgi:hypothetical protein